MVMGINYDAFFSAEDLKHTCLGFGIGEGWSAQQQGMCLADVVEPWAQPSSSHTPNTPIEL